MLFGPSLVLFNGHDDKELRKAPARPHRCFRPTSVRQLVTGTIVHPILQMGACQTAYQ